jgi:hypothetical protein
MGERVAQGWRDGAEPYPELGEGDWPRFNDNGGIHRICLASAEPGNGKNHGEQGGGDDAHPDRTP